MKKLTVSILLFMFSIPVFSQVRSDSEKQEVYFNYKERLQKFFTHIGSQAGESTPFAHVDYDYFCTNGVDTLKGKMEIGEGTIVLGQYIEVLAMEYYLLKQSSQDLSQIKNELYYALLAIQRLDLFGEEFFNGSPESNGFFVRDDVPQNFYEHWENLGDEIHMHGTHRTSGIVVDSVIIKDSLYLNKHGKLYSAFNTKEDSWKGCIQAGDTIDEPFRTKKSAEMSQDQAIELLLSLRMVVKFVDSVFVKPTVDDQGFNLLEHAKVQADRILTQISSTKNEEDFQLKVVKLKEFEGLLTIDELDANWWSKNPVTTRHVDRGAFSWGFAGALAETGNKISPNIYNENAQVIGSKTFNSQVNIRIKHDFDDLVDQSQQILLDLANFDSTISFSELVLVNLGANLFNNLCVNIDELEISITEYDQYKLNAFIMAAQIAVNSGDTALINNFLGSNVLTQDKKLVLWGNIIRLIDLDQSDFTLTMQFDYIPDSVILSFSLDIDKWNCPAKTMVFKLADIFFNVPTLVIEQNNDLGDVRGALTAAVVASSGLYTQEFYGSSPIVVGL